jgi:RNA polymerase sigma factor (sigma-70 family)
MVLRICRNHLRDVNDVDDAFQATFLALVRKAHSLWVQDSLGPWLHRVARRIAVRARANAARRREQERRAAESRSTIVSGSIDPDGLMALLHEEIDRLPERCRVPVVLCDLQGLTHEQAARRLGWPIGTLKTRLSRGRESLRARLARRGLAPAVALMKMTMTTPIRSASGAVPTGLAEATVRSARLVAAGAGATTAGAVPATVILLMEGALNTMFMTRIKFAILACGLIAGGAAAVAQQAGRRPEAAAPRPARARAAALPAALPGEDPAALAQEMAQLELGLLEDEVKLLRTQVSDALKEKVLYETSPARQDARTVNDAQIAYERARAVYLAKARELSSARRRIGKVEEPPKAEHGASGDAQPAEAHATDRKAPESGSHSSGAAVGSIDMDAVFKQYKKVQRSVERQKVAQDERRERLANLEANGKELAALMQKFTPGSSEYIAKEDQLTSLKQQLEREREQFERELTRRQAREMATLLEEIQDVVADTARTRGLDYVVKVSANPRPDAEPNDVYAAMNRSVLYANPRNDITEEVIRELNRRFEAAGEKASQ